MKRYIITGKGVRNDGFGRGAYGERRKRADGSRYSHSGTDYICTPGQGIFAPYSATYKRPANPYADSSEYTGALFTSPRITYKMFYFKPIIQIGESVKTGQLIGIAQDIGARYGLDSAGNPMVPHIHFEIVSVDPEYLREIAEPRKHRWFRRRYEKMVS